MKFNEFKHLTEAQFNSKQEVIDHFVRQGKSAAAGASAWERGWRGTKPKPKAPTGPVRSYHDDLDDKRYGETNEDSDPCWKNYKRKPGTKKYAPGSCVPKESIESLESQLAEAAIGTAPKRPARSGSRPDRGHEPAPRYKSKKEEVSEVSDDTKQSYKEKAEEQVKELEPHAKDGEYKDIAQRAIDRRNKGLKRVGGKLEEHKKGVIARKYTKKAKGAIGAADLKDKDDRKVIGPHKVKKIEKELAEARVEYNKKTARMEVNTDDADQRHGLYLNGKLVKTYSTKEQADNMKKRSPMYKDATVKKIAEGAKVDRMVKHIAKSERGLGKSKEDAESIAWATANKRGYLNNKNKKKHVEEEIEEQFCDECGGSLAETGKASRSLCVSSKPDSELGASQLSSCKAQGLRAREGKKSHKIGKNRVTMGGKKIKGKKYGGNIPDWS